MNCNNSGGLYLMSCYNCTIEGITWKKCGFRNISDDRNVYPVLQLVNSSNITIKNCSFQHSIGQAVVLSGMSGDIIISHCNFSYNMEYKDHGVAILYYHSSTFPLNFIITNCKFSYNEGAKSVAYFGQSPNTFLYLQNSEFNYNKGVPVYLSNQNLHITGNIKFHGNIVENGGGIVASDHSNVVVYKSATVNFTNNIANHYGGAVYLTNYSSILFKDRPTNGHCHDNQTYGLHCTRVAFHNNMAQFGWITAL